MSTKGDLHGLGCPRCGGMVPIPEGQAIVVCPFCELRSLVRGARGVRRYQVPWRVEQGAAQEALRRFLSSHRAIAGDAAQQADLQEAFLAYLPFWAVWGRVLGWVFGEKQVGNANEPRYKPREVKIAREMSWNGAACDVGEFGVERILLTDRPLEVFAPEEMHARGMVFEPVGSRTDAEGDAENSFQEQVLRLANLDSLGQVFHQTVNRRMGLVYYPLWVLRYLYRARVFQVVVDGYSGEVLYGKAPGNTLYRAAILIAGMAIGAFLAVDASAMVFYLLGNMEDGGDLIIIGVGLIVAGLTLMATAYRQFRFGQEFEFRRWKEGGGLFTGAINAFVKLLGWT